MRTELGKSWKGLGTLGPPARPGAQSHFHSAIGNIYSSNLCKGVVAEGGGPSSHGSVLIVKGLWGTPTPRKRKRPWRRPEPEAPPYRGGPGRDPAQSSCTSRGCVEEALLPTELTRTEWSTAGCAGLGLLLDTLE